MEIRKELSEAAAERILILDGAMGSMIQAYRSPNNKPLLEEDFRGKRFLNHNTNLRGCNDVLCLTQPDIIYGIHEAYLDAGADIIETCSLNANRISLKDFGLQTLAREISAASANLARKAADKYTSAEKKRFVAGSMGPTAKSATFTPNLDKPWERQIRWNELETAYYENAQGLIEGGADFLLVETVYDSLNAKAALFAIKRLSMELGRDIPVMVSATVSESGRLLTGQTPEAFCASMLHSGPLALGLNCSFGAEMLKVSLKKTARFSPCAIVFYPNAGLPNAHGHYSDTPEIMAVAAEACMKEGLVNIIGGCCGSPPAHIAAIAKKTRHYKPRSIPASCESRSNIPAGTQIPEFNDGHFIPPPRAAAVPWQSALNEGDYEEAISIALDHAEKGLKVLTVNTDQASDPNGTAENFIFLAAAFSDLAKLPILIESSSLDLIENGLKCFQGCALARYLGSPSEGHISTEDRPTFKGLDINEKIRSYGAIVIE